MLSTSSEIYSLKWRYFSGRATSNLGHWHELLLPTQYRMTCEYLQPCMIYWYRLHRAWRSGATTHPATAATTTPAGTVRGAPPLGLARLASAAWQARRSLSAKACGQCCIARHRCSTGSPLPLLQPPRGAEQEWQKPLAYRAHTCLGMSRP